MDVRPLILYDRSRVLKDWFCPRARYWQYEFAGRGVVSDKLAHELLLGLALHDGLAEIALQWREAGEVDVSAIARACAQKVFDAIIAATPAETPDFDRFAKEQSTLVQGLLLGFYRHVWPSMMPTGSKIIQVEKEGLYPHGDGLGFMHKADLVIEDPSGEWWYWEYKSTSSNDTEWVNSWQTAVQLHSTVKGIEVELNHPVTGVIVQGLYKGYESYGKQNSPMCYAYVRPGQPPFVKESIRYDYSQGYKRSPVWELAGGIEKWVAEMPAEILQDQFPQTPPIFIKDSLVDAFFRQRAVREHEIRNARSLEAANEVNYFDETFPQRFDQCRPPWGRGKRRCEYLKLCFGPPVDPLQAGYTWRVPHHEPEFVEQQELTKGQEG